LKCRFIIEKVIGDLKRHKALDNFTNNIIGHIQIDYRITCAMLNFTHRPCQSGGDQAQQMAARILKKIRVKDNWFKFILSIRLGSSSKSSPINLNDINDFPRLSTTKLKNKIYYGPYQHKQAKSYLVDIMQNSRGFSISERVIFKLKDERLKKKLAGCKIVACQITSRHRRGLITGTDTHRNVYKVFCAYLPGLNKTKAVKGILFLTTFVKISQVLN
jgi:hypothetical protein